MKSDDLQVLFEELRRLKREELPKAEAMDPVRRAMWENMIRDRVIAVERAIDREMKDET